MSDPGIDMASKAAWKPSHSEALQHAWRNADYNFHQRQSYFQYFISIWSALAGASVLLLSTDRPAAACLVALFLSVLSALLSQLDFALQMKIGESLQTLRHFENLLADSLGDDRIRITDNMKQAKGSGAFSRTKRRIYIVGSVFSLALLCYSSFSALGSVL